MSELIRVEHLCKYFKSPRGTLHAVEDISFSLNEGTTLGVVGESGCGKSTLGRTMIGLLPATSGHVYYDGKDITQMSRRELHHIHMDLQMIFQDPYSSLDPRKCVSKIIAEPLIVNHIYKTRAERDHRVEELMEVVGLAPDLALSYPHELDGGRRQRIGVARALAINPKFIVCDEPVSALDVSIQAQILNLLMDIQEKLGITYIFITHDLSVVKHISDEIMVMYLGCAVERCATDELYEHPLHPYTKGLISAIPIPNIHIEHTNIILQGDVTSPINPPAGCRFASRCAYAEDCCRKETPVLEEVLPDHFCACLRVKEINGLQPGN